LEFNVFGKGILRLKEGWEDTIVSFVYKGQSRDGENVLFVSRCPYVEDKISFILICKCGKQKPLFIGNLLYRGVRARN